MAVQSIGKNIKVLVIGFFVLLVNSSYLAAYADPTQFNQSNKEQ